MISIKRFIERSDGDLFRATLEAYRSALSAMGESGVEACPQPGGVLRARLDELRVALADETTAGGVQETGQKVDAEIAQWGSNAADYIQQRAEEAKELMMILATTAELTVERDTRYSRKFHDFTGRLEAIAGLDDLKQVHDSLLESAKDLKHCVETMAEESRKSVARLRADVTVYQERLDEAERLAAQDPLTGLYNRRRVESAIKTRIERQKPFTVLILDLNEFKQLNDACGHLAGDELLRQFGAELKSAFRAGDVVGRLGGDEFVVILDKSLKEARSQIERVSRWVFGDYTIQVGEATRRVPLDAAVGTAEWEPGDSLQTLLERADAAMYRDKKASEEIRRP